MSTEALAAAFAKTTGALLNERQPGGHWTGKLSSSALSTATAVCALAIYRRHALEPPVSTTPLILRGLDWLARHINPDGGWGDTDMSLSNLSTTALCWAAFGAADESRKYSQTVNRAEAYLRGAAGGIDPGAIARAVTVRYGKDRTFSVPILVTCALSGRFGKGPEAWREIRPLPFELGALPREWFGALRLPVVSYALPALIALGQVIHHYRLSLNPVTRWIRNLTRRRTLRVLSDIQPLNGGFLEAIPLTSFVTMSLAAAGLANHSVTLKGIEFLVRSVQDNGSWPIDTNLSTWLTTLSINAMPAQLDFEDRRRLRAWLLAQQFRSQHPYTNAAPGGWAWTDLPGGVPDADDTAGALLALYNLGDIDATVRSAALAGIRWLLDLQNRDGGMPTFCRGWSTMLFDRSSPDLTAHAVRAWSALARRISRRSAASPARDEARRPLSCQEPAHRRIVVTIVVRKSARARRHQPDIRNSARRSRFAGVGGAARLAARSDAREGAPMAGARAESRRELGRVPESSAIDRGNRAGG